MGRPRWALGDHAVWVRGCEFVHSVRPDVKEMTGTAIWQEYWISHLRM